MTIAIAVFLGGVLVCGWAYWNRGWGRGGLRPVFLAALVFIGWGIMVVGGMLTIDAALK